MKPLLLITALAAWILPAVAQDAETTATSSEAHTPAAAVPAAQPATEPATGDNDVAPAATADAPSASAVTNGAPSVPAAVTPVAPQPAARTATAQQSPRLDVQYPAPGELSLVFPTTQESAESVAVDAEERITVDFPDEEVRVIVRNVADLFELNVIIPDSLTGRTSLKLRNVTWQQVFNVVLEPRGFTFVEDGNIIKIRSIAELQAEPTVTRVFLINFADANELQGSLNPLINAAAGGRIVVDRRSNALVITERPSRMSSIQEIIDRLDRPTAQVAIETKFIDLSVDDERDLGLDWQIDGMQVGDVTLNAATGWGTGGAFPSPTTGANMVVLSPIQFDVMLRSMQVNQRGRLVSNPTVTTLNNMTASINIGEEYPIPEYNYNAETGTFEVSGFEFKPIGINLNVTPQVNSAGFINLRIMPEISRQNGFVTFGGAAGTQIPIIATRKAETDVTIKDGFTLAIGGLIETASENSKTGIPYIMDIPIIGALFRVDSNQDQRRDLIIFVTAKTLNPDGTDFREIVSPEQMYQMGLTELDLPGRSYSEAELASYLEAERLRAAQREQERLATSEESIRQLQRELRDEKSKSSSSSSQSNDSNLRRPQYRAR